MELARIAEVQDQKDKAKLYEQALEQLFTTPSLADSKIFIEHLADSDVPLVVSRPILSRLATGLSRFPEDIQYDVANLALSTLITREVSFDDQVTTVREFLAEKLQQREEWGEAAKMMSAVDVERAGRDIDDVKKLEHYINVTMLFLEDEDSVSAERFLVKARNLIGEVADERLNLKYKACYARICDSKRKFLEAATHYYDLSTYSTIQCASAGSLCNRLASAPSSPHQLTTIHMCSTYTRMWMSQGFHASSTTCHAWCYDRRCEQAVACAAVPVCAAVHFPTGPMFPMRSQSSSIAQQLDHHSFVLLH
eukprot:jgi/Ulvmu1/11608/UM008_0009.1